MTITPLHDAPVAPMTAPDAGAAPRYIGAGFTRAASHDDELRRFGTELRGRADADGFITTGADEMLGRLERITGYPADRLRREPWRVTQMLDTAGVALAPAPELDRFRLRLRMPLIAYAKTQPLPVVRTRHYQRGIVFVKLLTLMLPNLSIDEVHRADELIDTWVSTPRYRRHLRAMLRWYRLRRRQLDPTTRQQVARALDRAEAERLASQLLSFAAGRGMSLTPASISQLERIMKLLGCDGESVHALLHRARCGTPAIPEHTPGSVTALATLDTARLQSIERSTAGVQQLLADVFDSEADTPADPPADTATDAPLRRLLERLAEREEWPVAEADDVAAETGCGPLLPALETLNDRAYDTLGDAAADLDGPTLYINTDTARQLISML